MYIIIHICHIDCRQSYIQMALVVPQRLRLGYLRMQLRRVHRERDYLIAALILEEQRKARQQRRRRTMWVKPWLLRRVTLGHYDNLMQELMRESRGDFKGFLRMEPAMFQEMLVRVAPCYWWLMALFNLFSGCLAAALRLPCVCLGICQKSTAAAGTPYGDRASSLQMS